MAAVILHVRAGFNVLFGLFGHRMMAPVMLGTLLVTLQATPEYLVGWPNLFVHTVMTCFLVSVVVREDHNLAPVMKWRPVARIGEISYGLYLYHLIGLHIGNEIATALGMGGSVWFVTLIFVIASIIIADVSFRTYEQYFLKFKHRTA